MSTEVVMPQMGADMQEGTLLRWLKHPGDHVARGEAIAEIETDKANVELESFEDGVLESTLVEEGQVVPVGEPIAMIGNATVAAAPSPASAATPAEPAGVVAPARPAMDAGRNRAGSAPATSPAATAVTIAAAPVARDGTDAPRVFVSPVARNVARDLGVDLETVHGSGPDGRIVRRDVEAAAAAARSGVSAAPAGAPAAAEVPRQPEHIAEPVQVPAAATVAAALPVQAAPLQAPPVPTRAAQPAVAAGVVAEVQPLSRMRQAIARRMAQSKREAPHYYVTVEVDMTAAMALRETLNQAAGAESDTHVSVNDMIVKACAEALRHFASFNAGFSDAGLVMHERINVCIAIALPDGLIAPAVLDLGEKSLGAISREAKDLAGRARGGMLRGPELNDGTFTVSNLGMYGIETLIPIIQPGQSAILGAGAVLDKPAVHEGAIAIRKLMMLALAADHRVTDGAEGAEFVREIKTLLENPVRLAL